MILGIPADFLRYSGKLLIYKAIDFQVQLKLLKYFEITFHCMYWNNTISNLSSK